MRVAAANIQAVFNIATDVAPPWPDPTDALFSHRSQYNAAKIIKHLAADIHAPVRRIGIISQDISLPFLTYVFGEAQIGGRAAVLSTYRLQRHRDGVVPEKSLIYRRLAKITIHETGLLLGLSHCQSPRCILNFSVGLDKLDSLTPTLCDHCKISLKSLLCPGCESMDSEH